MEQSGINIEVLRYLSLSLGPVIIIGVGVIIIRIFSKKNKQDDKSPSGKL